MIWLYAACFGGALLLLLALFAPWGRGSIDIAWFLVAAVLLLFLAGLKARSVILEQAIRLREESRQEERLLDEIESQRREIDALADGFDVALLVCDARANVLYANRTAVEMFGFDEPMGRSILAVSLSHDLERITLRALEKREAATAEVTLGYPQERMVRAKAWPDPIEGRAFLSLYDVTDIRRLERIRQDFVANVSHELRTPLANIRAIAETLLDELKHASKESKQYLEQIIVEVDRLSQLSGDLLVLSAAESGPIRKQGCDLSAVVRGVVNQLRAKAQTKGLKLSFDGPERLPIEANPTQMTQVAINLIDNALNYTNEGEVRAKVSQNGDDAVFEVADTGIGIASEHLPRIFERFYRVDKGRSRATGGTGLGLSIVRNIVEVHGGTVSVQSTLGKGTTFKVTQPIGEIAEEKTSIDESVGS